MAMIQDNTWNQSIHKTSTYIFMIRLMRSWRSICACHPVSGPVWALRVWKMWFWICPERALVPGRGCCCCCCCCCIICPAPPICWGKFAAIFWSILAALLSQRRSGSVLVQVYGPTLSTLQPCSIAQRYRERRGDLRIDVNVRPSGGKDGSRENPLRIGGEPNTGLQPAYDCSAMSTWS